VGRAPFWPKSWLQNAAICVRSQHVASETNQFHH
jgi:hypothetical protein